MNQNILKSLRKMGALCAAVLTLTTVTNVKAEQTPYVTYNTNIEFEDAANYSSDAGNAVRNDQFSRYSSNGYLYLASGYADVKFTVPADGYYYVFLYSNSDQDKHNWVYVDDQSLGDLNTTAKSADKWNAQRYLVKLTAGEHKVGVSTDWGYVALDNVAITSMPPVPDALPPFDHWYR